MDLTLESLILVKKKSKSSYNKNYVTKSNLLINGIFNNTNYVNKIIYLDFRDSK